MKFIFLTSDIMGTFSKRVIVKTPEQIEMKRILDRLWIQGDKRLEQK